MNNIMRMNIVNIKDKITKFSGDGFVYKDRKVSKAGKIWVKDERSRDMDLEMEDRKQFIKSQIRNGILTKDLKILT